MVTEPKRATGQLRGVSPAAEMVSTFHQDTHAVHSYEAYHQQAEGTHLETSVADKKERDKQVGLGVSPVEAGFGMIKTLLRYPPVTELLAPH